jgi:GMP synthase-like glutamine amidotransferase
MKIGILQTGPLPPELSEKHGTYPEMFERLLAPYGFAFETWAVMEGVFPPGPEAADGWLITGSRHGAYDDLPWIPKLEDLIRAIFGADRPLVGVCFGHQIIAQALGGKVEKYKGGWSVGPQTYEFPDRARTVHAWHQDQVVERPPGAEVLAASDFCKYAALHYPGKAYTVQPHPEFDDGFAHALATIRGPGVVPAPLLAQAEARLGTPLDSSDLAAQFARFFQERRVA